MQLTLPIIHNATRIIDAWLPWKIKYDRTPGMAVGVVFKGKTVFTRGYGFASLVPKRRVTKDTLFHIASISKTFTALSIMQLVERKKLSLIDPVSRYIPRLRNKDQVTSKEIIIKDLLTHSSGILRDGTTPHWTNGHFPKNLNIPNGAKMFYGKKGSFKYSNYGFSILGEVIECVSGMSYESYEQKHILRPLYMSRTRTDYDSELLGYGQGYERIIPDELRHTISHRRTYAFAPATGFISSAADLCRYLAALSYPTSSSKIVSPATFRQMIRPHIRIKKNDHYGLGFHVEKIQGHTIVSHGGGFNGFITFIAFDPKTTLGVVVLTNANDTMTPEIAMGIFETANSLVRIPPQRPYIVSHPSRYEGLYRSVWSDTVVKYVGSRLIAFNPNSTSPLKDVAVLKPTNKENIFIMGTTNRYDYVDEEVIFSGFIKGKAQQVSWGPTPQQRVN